MPNPKSAPIRDQGRFPNANAFFKHMRKIEKACDLHTARALRTAGVKAPECIDKLGTLLSQLYRVACCYWGCRGSESGHFAEFLTARTVASALAAVRLIGFGYYDEALALVRNVAEIANLMCLFAGKPELVERWVNLGDPDRRREFSAVKVRKLCEEHRLRAPYDQDHYGALCSVGSHANPRVKPGSHNLQDRATVGAIFQQRGFLVALNELALAVVSVGVGASLLCKLPEDVRRALAAAVKDAFRSVGGVDLRHPAWPLGKVVGAAPKRGEEPCNRHRAEGQT